MIDGNDSQLFFSIILAFRNEELHLETCLNSFDEQTLPREFWEVILVDGCSTDRSRKIAEEYVTENRNAKLVDNPKKIATSGWNAGLKAANGKYYHIANGHSITDKYFFEKARQVLSSGQEIHALGGKIFKVGHDKLSGSISEATNLLFAMGGSYYRIGAKPRKTNVIGQGIYLKDLIKSIGSYDEEIKRSGDWEFNYRICANGFNMYFDPGLVIKVFTRSNYKTLFFQQMRTGFWKIRVWAKHRNAILPRHFIPAFFVLWLIFIPIALASKIIPWFILFVPLLIYFILALYSSFKASKENTNKFYVFLTFPLLHIAYGCGFLAGLIRWFKYFFKRPDRKKSYE